MSSRKHGTFVFYEWSRSEAEDLQGLTVARNALRGWEPWGSQPQASERHLRRSRRLPTRNLDKQLCGGRIVWLQKSRPSSVPSHDRCLPPFSSAPRPARSNTEWIPGYEFRPCKRRYYMLFSSKQPFQISVLSHFLVLIKSKFIIVLKIKYYN